MTEKFHQKRRTFLINGTKAVAGTLLASHALQPERAISERTSKGKIIGCYTSVKEILDNPKYIDALQKRLGVNILLSGGPIKMPDWLHALNPLKNGRTMYTGVTDDDSRLLQAIENTHRRGMKFWLYFSGHHNRPEDREVMSETFEGVKFADLPPITYALSQGELTTCFEKPVVKEYEKQLFGYASRTYDVDNMYVSHTRYATPSFWTNLFGCACSECQKAAYRMGYDFGKMKRSMQNLRHRLENLDRKTIEYAAGQNLLFSDFLSLLGEDDCVIDWLFFRTRVVGNALKRIHDAIHTSTNHRCGFVTDTHNATMAFWVGHNFEDLIGGASDGLHPLSWCAYQHISVIAAWANQLCLWVPDLDESVALKIVTAFFGWDDLGLPDKKIADLRIGKSSAEHPIFDMSEKGFYAYFNPDLTINLMTHEWKKMAAINRGRLPTHPCIKGYEWPEKVCRELIEQTEEIGLDGYIFQRTETLIDRDKL